MAYNTLSKLYGAGSVTAAAHVMGVNQTTVSRRISALEDYLGKDLFIRSGKRWLLTTIGEQLVETAERMAEEANAIQCHVLADSQELSGLLRITVADVCTQHLAMPAVKAFTQQYPDVDLEIIATRDELNLTAREADVALRTTDEPPQIWSVNESASSRMLSMDHKICCNKYRMILGVIMCLALPG